MAGAEPTTSAVVLRSAAWSPGVETEADLEAWIAAPRPLQQEGHPDAKFLPAMLRRRCKPLTRIMLTAAYACCPQEELSQVRTVFTSRHGSINESIGLLHAIADSQRVSAATFSHTVHNAQAGLFSIAASNRRASSSIAASEDSFPAGFLEALTHLHRAPDDKVLLVTGDVPLAPTFASLIAEPQASYAVALLLGTTGHGPRVSLNIEPPAPAAEQPQWPAALDFLRWLETDQPDLNIPTPARTWRLHRST